MLADDEIIGVFLKKRPRQNEKLKYFRLFDHLQIFRD